MEDRREACIAHLEKTEELRTTVFGKDSQPGIKYETISLKYSIKSLKSTNKIILALNVLIFGALVKLIFFV